MKAKKQSRVGDLASMEQIATRICFLRGKAVMFDFDLAALYGVETRVVIQGVKRNKDRFPGDFMFQLTQEEFQDWRSQFVMSNPGAKMGLRRQPYAFTEHGVAMLASVLRSQTAVEISISIIRSFVTMRKFISSNEELARKVAEHDGQIGYLFERMDAMIEVPESKKKKPIGFICP